MLAKWDALNKKNANWNPGVWWEGFEEDDLITCGTCTGESEESTGLCTCSESDTPDGRKSDQDDHQTVETIPEGRMGGTSSDIDNTEDQNQRISNNDDPGMSKVTLEVTGHLDESLADKNDITQGQGTNNSFSYNNKKSYKKSSNANKKK